MPYPLPLEALSPSPANTQAIIDIGSNSVRMVVYHAPVRVPVPLFNEKYLCGLGEILAATGRLHEEAKAKTRQVLERFLLMTERLHVQHLYIMATAAIRDAEDGREFVAELENAYGVTIHVISGEEEAALAAKGIIASSYAPHGIAADLGGGSMELAYLRRDSIIKQSTLEAGVLRLMEACGQDIIALTQAIDEHLGTIDWLGKVTAPQLYAIGGSFRSLAKWHMRSTGYPLKILHEYHLSARTVKEQVAYLGGLSIAEIADLPGMSRKRATMVLPAAVTLERVMHHAGMDMVYFSVSGIREGYLYDSLPDNVKSQDPLIASVSDLAALTGRKGEYAEELFAWIAPLFLHDTDAQIRLRKAACILGELAWTIDPNFRGEWAYYRVIQSSLKGLSHKERVMLALALYYRYHRKWKKDQAEFALLDERERLWAKCLGHAMHLAFHLSGGYAGNLHHASLVVDNEVSLVLDEAAKPLRTAEVEKRLDGLGSSWSALSNLLI